MIDRNQVNEIIKRFEDRGDIRGVIITDPSGLPLDSSLDSDTTEAVAAHVTSLLGKGSKIVDSLKEGKLKFIRLETGKGEIMVALEENLILIVLK
jgi:predicted regulator of Ras-like GTPase activity (Roadblock/LC7/MglB family)